MDKKRIKTPTRGLHWTPHLAVHKYIYGDSDGDVFDDGDGDDDDILDRLSGDKAPSHLTYITPLH